MLSFYTLSYTTNVSNHLKQRRQKLSKKAKNSSFAKYQMSGKMSTIKLAFMYVFLKGADVRSPTPKMYWTFLAAIFKKVSSIMITSFLNS